MSNKIRNISMSFRIIFQILLVVLPLTLIISWTYAPEELRFAAGVFKLQAIPDNYAGMHTYTKPGTHFLPTEIWKDDKAILHTLTPNEKILGGLVSAVPTLIKMFILYCLISLFKRYEKGDIFSIQHVKYFRNIGIALLAEQLIIQPIYQFVMGVVLTMNNPPHHRFASITFDQTNIAILFTAILLVLMSWIMSEGNKLREDQQLTI